jgi:hypothetical protein
MFSVNEQAHIATRCPLRDVLYLPQDGQLSYVRHYELSFFG